MPESPQEVVPVKETPLAAPLKIETPSTKGIIHSIIPSFIYLLNAYYVHGISKLGNNKQIQIRLDSFPQDFMPHPILEGSNFVAMKIILVQLM